MLGGNANTSVTEALLSECTRVGIRSRREKAVEKTVSVTKDVYNAPVVLCEGSGGGSVASS